MRRIVGGGGSKHFDFVFMIEITHRPYVSRKDAKHVRICHVFGDGTNLKRCLLMLVTSFAVQTRTSYRCLSVIFVCCLLVYVTFMPCLQPTASHIPSLYLCIFLRLLSAVMSSTPSRLKQSHCRKKHYPSSTYLTHV